MKNKILPYIVIFTLLFVILTQNRSCDRSTSTKTKIDTLIVYDTIKETIPGKTIFIKEKIDTSIWIKKPENKPDTTYQGLLKQYKNLGLNYYATRVFETDFKIGEYGHVTLTDSVRENQIIHSDLKTFLTIPTTTITIEKQAPPKIQLYSGFHLTGNRIEPLSGVYGDMILKTKKDKLYSVSIGYNGELQYGFGMHWKLKIR